MSRPASRQGAAGEDRSVGLVRDLRSKAWCWQDKEAVRLIRRHWQSAPPEATTLAAALGVYLVLTELASNASNPASFSAPRRRMAELAGVSERTLLRYIRAFEALGLLRVEERRLPGDESVQLPNAYALLDPPPPEGVALAPPPATDPTASTPPPAAGPSSGRAPAPRRGRADATRPGSADAIDQEEFHQEETSKEERRNQDDKRCDTEELGGSEIWERAQQILVCELTRANYSTWIEGLQVAGWTNQTITLSAPSAYVLDWVQTRLRGAIEKAIIAAGGRRVAVQFVQSDSQTDSRE
jgi:hypothetical protein